VAVGVDPVDEPVETALDAPPADFATDDPHDARTTRATIQA
jgi:hypothetical protein